MAFQLTFHKPLPDEVAAVWREQVDKTSRRFARDKDMTAAVHGSRKAFKRLRALIQLIAPGLRKREARTENRRFRDLGRSLAQARDLQVMSETLDRLGVFADMAESKAMYAARAILAGQVADKVEVGAPADLIDRTAVRKDLRDARAALGQIDLSGVTDKALIDGFIAAYRTGCGDLKIAQTAEEDDLVHEWRKAVQAHWRHCALLNALWPDEMNVRVETARMISQYIGFDHDLSVLIAWIEAHTGAGLTRPQAAKLIKPARASQNLARQAGFELGARLYAAPPSAMRTMAEAWLQQTRREAEFGSSAPECAVFGLNGAGVANDDIRTDAPLV